MQSTGLMLFWLLAVLALIPVSLWLLKRSGLATGMAGEMDPAVLRSVSQISLGAGQRVVTVEVNNGDQRTWLVLGVTPQQITTLHSFSPVDAPAQGRGASAGLPPFAQLLRRSTDKAAAPPSPPPADPQG